MPSKIETMSTGSEDERYWLEDLNTRGLVSPALSTSSSGSSNCLISSSPPPLSSASPAMSSASDDSMAEMSSITKTKEFRTKKPYRMASSFALGCEQPDVVYASSDGSSPCPKQPAKPAKSKARGDTFKALFGPPTPKLAQNRRTTNSTSPNPTKKIIRKPLPVNPLTGERLGSQGSLDIDEYSRTRPNLLRTDFSRFKRPPPGGFSSQLWWRIQISFRLTMAPDDFVNQQLNLI